MRAVSRPVGTAIMDPDLAYLDEPEEAASDVDTGDDGAVVDDNLGKLVYLSQCESLSVTPVAQVLKYLEHDEMFISHYGLGLQGVRALAAALKVNRAVRALHLCDNSVPDEGAALLADMLLINPRIEELDLSENSIKLLGCMALGGALAPKKCNLRNLCLSRNGLTDRECVELTQAIENNTTLSHLDLSHNSIGDRGAIAFGRMLSNNVGLVDVDLSWNALRPRGAIAIADGLVPNLKLQVLNISWCGIQDAGAAAFGPCLVANSTLTHLMMSGNSFTAVGLGPLCDGVAVNGSLAAIAVDHNVLREEGARLVLACLERNVGIVYWRVDNTHCSDTLRISIDMILEVRREDQLLQQDGEDDDADDVV